MRSSVLLAGVIGTFASTAFAADCAAQNIVDACVSGYKGRIDACNKNGNDWICLCDVYTDVLTCYNNCPDSKDRSPVQNQVTSFCTAAEPLRASASSSMASVASVAKTATTAQPTAASTASNTGSATGASASASAPAFASGAASSLTTPAGAAAVALFAAAGLF
ncbi:hypothetical protein E8E12_008226 [Didymella heteroderae]|uniref:GPI anchored serine-threonine rich protein n=1 Tax=Didymella heteroderae TaxID=1769908 RepID=A0A9P4WQT9_9PLEO|nr:hypothetical protein E8E12_008226 [Didymella heteroderae]